MIRTGGDERSARPRVRAGSTSGPFSRLSVWAAENAIPVRMSNFGKCTLLKFKKVARGRPADGTPWPFLLSG
jgi:hypothetical protein